MTTEFGLVRQINIEDEMRSSYLDYAMSVIVQRALPDVRDGLKPGQRRILYAMHELGLTAGARYRKSAAVVGEVLGKYHPHSDVAVYDTIVRLAQDFSMRYQLVDGQGNFGSVDGDSAAAMRYTEARMTAIAEELVVDMDRDTVDWMRNYDDTRDEPTVLPAKLPNLLVNGAAGIAVGMATSIPPHNLGEVCDAIVYLLKNPEASVVELSEIIHGPDFPTAGIILGKEGIRSAYATGRGRVVLRARHELETLKNGRAAIIITELPYQVNKALLQERIADLVNDGKVDGIATLRDESDRTGMRLVIELKRDGRVQSVLNQLFKHTALQSVFSINMLALVDNAPRVLTLEMMLRHYVTHRRVVITRRTRYELGRQEGRAHVLAGLRVALDNLDAVISTIRGAPSADEASARLQGQFALSETQAKAILAITLGRLAAMERQSVLDELARVEARVRELQSILADPERVDAILIEELIELKRKFGDPRRTVIIDQEVGEFSEEDLIAPEDVVVSMTSRGYVKRIPADTYRSQRRGGKGIRGMGTVDADAVAYTFVANTHDDILFFTTRGRAFHLKAHELPGTSREARGVPVNNLISLDGGETVSAILPLTSSDRGGYLVMATRRGVIKRTALSEFRNVRRNGLIAVGINEGDELVWVRTGQGTEDIVVVTSDGRAIRFPQEQVRSMGRTATGVRGIRLHEGDQVVTMDLVRDDAELLTVSERGYGKRTMLADYPVQGRGGQGVYAMQITDKTGALVAAQVVDSEGDEMLLMSADGKITRGVVSDVRRTGRNAQGVMVMRLKEGDSVVSVALLRPTGPEASVIAPSVADSDGGGVEDDGYEADADGLAGVLDDESQETVDDDDAGLDSQA